MPSPLRAAIASTACALCVAGVTACSLLADLDGLADGTRDASAVAPRDSGEDVRSTSDSAIDATNDAGGSLDSATDAPDAATSDLLFFDDFETGAACEGWNAAYGTAATSDPGYQSARACLICRTGDIYVDKDVANPRLGGVGVELWVKRINTTPAGSNAHALVAFYTTPESSTLPKQVLLTDTWTRLSADGTPAVPHAMVKIRLRVDEGCFLVDGIRARSLP